MNANSNYQYRAFGAPGLGLKRGLGRRLGDCPLRYRPGLDGGALRRPAKTSNSWVSKGMEGNYGLYESIDYTPSRLQRGQSSAIVYSFMAHHHGMSLLSLAYLLLDKPLQKLFEAEPQFKAALYYCRSVFPGRPLSSGIRPTLQISIMLPADAETRVINTPNTLCPKCNYCPMAEYHVMLTNAGGGYSIWKDLAVTRWQEDGTCDNRGSFCYIRDLEQQYLLVKYPSACA
jgi:cyclic beta-1,2-glucan synthetase